MNRLKDQVSPYLAQHAENPVDWWPWGPDAFAEAQASNRPILLSIGYAACHWCHVMAHESFEDPDTAAVMNRLFVNIKVDREERPDVDHVYMTALQALGQQGGWPMTMFLTPDGRPFWGGTYFPKTARYGQPAFVNVLTSIEAAYRKDGADIQHNARALTAAIGRQPEAHDQPVGNVVPLLDEIAVKIAALYDPINGGMNGAPKFPSPPVLELLWRGANRTGDESVGAPQTLTLERMTRGGIHDHAGGGFARYAVDPAWLVPHFEKMLYDNAQLLPQLALAARQTGSAMLEAAATGIVTWLAEDMTTPSGAFAASEDADSLDASGHAHEGAFYVWTPEEVFAVLGERTRAFCDSYDIAPGGNFEGKSIPNRLAGGGVTDDAHRAHAQDLADLRRARAKRPRPLCDDKVLADWNGLAITGITRAATLLNRPDWLPLARRAYDGVRDVLQDADGALGHASRLGKKVHPGFASDHAAMSLAALALYETTGDASLIGDATRWAEILQARYLIDQGTLAMTAAGTADLPVRPAPTHDDAVPNANAVAAEVYVRLFAVTGEPIWLTRADALLAACAFEMRRNPYGHAALLNALNLRTRMLELTLTGPRDSALATVALAVPYPNRMIRWTGGDAATATVCVDGRCSLPIDDPETFRLRIAEASGRAP